MSPPSHTSTHFCNPAWKHHKMVSTNKIQPPLQEYQCPGRVWALWGNRCLHPHCLLHPQLTTHIYITGLINRHSSCFPRIPLANPREPLPSPPQRPSHTHTHTHHTPYPHPLVFLEVNALRKYTKEGVLFKFK